MCRVDMHTSSGGKLMCIKQNSAKTKINDLTASQCPSARATELVYTKSPDLELCGYTILLLKKHHTIMATTATHNLHACGERVYIILLG